MLNPYAMFSIPVFNVSIVAVRLHVLLDSRSTQAPSGNIFIRIVTPKSKIRHVSIPRNVAPPREIVKVVRHLSTVGITSASVGCQALAKYSGERVL